jgi:cobalamin biosynthesis Mg chelatase CobN
MVFPSTDPDPVGQGRGAVSSTRSRCVRVAAGGRSPPEGAVATSRASRLGVIRKTSAHSYRPQMRAVVFEQEAESMSTENIIIVVVIVLIVLFVLGYFGRGRFRG